MKIPPLHFSLGNICESILNGEYEPSKLIEYGEKNSLELEKIDGIKFNPIIDEWKISKDQSVNYIAKFTKF